MQIKLRPLINTHQLWCNTELLNRGKNMNIQHKTASPQSHAAFQIRKKATFHLSILGYLIRHYFFLQILHYVLLKKKKKKKKYNTMSASDIVFPYTLHLRD